MITVVCVIVMIVVSLLTKEPDYAKITGDLRHDYRRTSQGVALQLVGRRRDASIALVALIVIIYVYFSG
jgi:hypothetical protein